jgi:hypothetical protein
MVEAVLGTRLAAVGGSRRDMNSGPTRPPPPPFVPPKVCDLCGREFEFGTCMHAREQPVPGTA